MCYSSLIHALVFIHEMVKPARVCQYWSGGAVMKLTNRVTNITKNNKGFSLLEVLVGVSIIGIISAIAVPTYQNYTREASKTAADTTLNNVVKSYNNCTVLKAASECTSLDAIGITCPDCSSSTSATGFCADIHKSSGGKDIKACVQINGNSVKRTYGASGTNDVFKDITICHVTITAATTSGCAAVPVSAMPGAKECTTGNVATVCGAVVNAGTNTCGRTYTCVKATTTGTCTTGACL